MGSLKWAHDKIREAALNLIGDDDAKIAQVQFEIGKLLFCQPERKRNRQVKRAVRHHQSSEFGRRWNAGMVA